MKNRGYKNFKSEIKDLNEAKGIAVVYANSFNRLDSDEDISGKGSFAKTLKENVLSSKWFLNHNRNILLGVPLIEGSKEDDFGLLAVNQFNMEKEISRDTFFDYKLFAEHGRTLEHSIGYDVIKRDEKDKRIITEYKLWEISTLTHWGANSDTPLVDLKEYKEIKNIIDHLELMFKYNFSDERLKRAEKLINELRTLEMKEPSKDTPNLEPFNWVDFLNNNLKFIK